MKVIYIFLGALLIVSCSKTTSTETTSTEGSSDSLVVADSLVDTGNNQSDVASDEPVGEGENEFDVELYFDETSHVIMSEEESFYQVSATFSGYESSSDVTWFFDKEFSVRCYKQSWSMEGQEGSEEYYLRNDSVICVLEVESGGMGTITTRVCKGIEGKKMTENYDQAPVNEVVLASYIDTKRKSIDDYLGQLITLLKGSEITETGNDMYTIKIENVIDVGQEVTETTTVTIPKVLYDKLLN